LRNIDLKDQLPAFVKWKKQIIQILKTNPQFKNITFKQSQLIAFGGEAWSSLSNFETAAGNELTWAVRHAPPRARYYQKNQIKLKKYSA
jgi:hypothetical protein